MNKQSNIQMPTEEFIKLENLPNIYKIEVLINSMNEVQLQKFSAHCLKEAVAFCKSSTYIYYSTMNRSLESINSYIENPSEKNAENLHLLNDTFISVESEVNKDLLTIIEEYEPEDLSLFKRIDISDLLAVKAGRYIVKFMTDSRKKANKLEYLIKGCKYLIKSVYEVNSTLDDKIHLKVSIEKSLILNAVQILEE